MRFDRTDFLNLFSNTTSLFWIFGANKLLFCLKVGIKDIGNVIHHVEKQSGVHFVGMAIVKGGVKSCRKPSSTSKYIY